MLIATGEGLTETNKLLSAENERQRSENHALTNLIQTSKAALEMVQAEKTNLAAQLELVRAEVRQKELALVDKDRSNAIDLLSRHVQSLEKDSREYIEWEKQPEDIVNLLNSEWRTNLIQHLAEKVVLNPQTSERTRFACAFILYHHDGSDERWKKFLIETVRSGNATPFLISLRFSYGSDTNKPGYWKEIDAEEVWTAAFEAFCRTIQNGNVQPQSADLIVSHGVHVPGLTRAAYQRLTSKFCNVRNILHAQALTEVNKLDQKYMAGAALRFFQAADPILLVVMTAKKIAQLSSPVTVTDYSGDHFGFLAITQMIEYPVVYGDDLPAKFQQLGIPSVKKSGTDTILDPLPWKEWVANSNNIPLIEAASSTNLTHWDYLISQRTKM